MHFKVFDLFLLLFCAAYYLPKCNTTFSSTTPIISSSTYPTPPPLDFDEEVKKLADFNDGLEILFEIYNATDYHKLNNNDCDTNEKIGKNFKKVMEASRKCGIALRRGLHIPELRAHFKDKNETNVEISKYETLSQKLHTTIIHLDFAIGFAISSSNSYVYGVMFKDMVIDPFEKSISSFRKMLEEVTAKDNSYFEKFKKDCTETWNDTLFMRQLEPHNYLENLLELANYNDELFINSYKIFKGIIEYEMATYPMCNIYKNGIPDNEVAYNRSTEFISTIRYINKRFQELNYKRQEKSWSKENIVRIVKKYAFGDNLEDFSDDSENEKIAKRIYDDIFRNYGNLGYKYHVSVSKTGLNGNNDTLLQCSTECHYLYNINNKDIYILRNKKVQFYEQCKLMISKNDFDQYRQNCSKERNPTNLIELSKQIQAECNPTAFSLVRSAMKFQFETARAGFNNPLAFAQKCFGDIYVKPRPLLSTFPPKTLSQINSTTYSSSTTTTTTNDENFILNF